MSGPVTDFVASHLATGSRHLPRATLVSSSNSINQQQERTLKQSLARSLPPVSVRNLVRTKVPLTLYIASVPVQAAAVAANLKPSTASLPTSASPSTAVITAPAPSVAQSSASKAPTASALLAVQPSPVTSDLRTDQLPEYVHEALSETSVTAMRAIAGSVAGAVAAVFTAPLDLAKTRLQVQIPGVSPMMYRGAWGTLKTTLQHEGWRGPFKGLGSTLLGLVPNWAVYFSAYGFFQDQLTEIDHSGHRVNKFGSSTWTHIVASALAGATTAFVTNPLWLVKVRLQTQAVGKERYTGIIHAFRTIAKEEGIRGFYKGLPAALLGVSHAMVQFPVYEAMKDEFSRSNIQKARERAFVQQLQAQSKAPASSSSSFSSSTPAPQCAQTPPSHLHHHPPTLSPWQYVTASSCSKVLASLVSYPHEVLRSRLFRQRETIRYNGLFHAMSRIRSEEGLIAFYNGFGTNLLRVVPSCALTFTVYEYTFEELQRRQEEARALRRSK